MISFHKLVATVFGIGYVGKGGGTVAAIVYCLIWFFAAGDLQGHWQLFIVAAIIAVGVWSGNVVDAVWGKDSNKVVIDEVAGMMITLLFIPLSLKYVVAGLVLFRFFDILKPLLIRRMENLPKGWGVMGDDVLAGIYAQVILQLIVLFKLF
jgi:phosphatidylglycerophosphatase A